MLKVLLSLCRPSQDKPTERPAGWHPGPHGHHLRAQILAYFYLDMLHAAIQGERPHVHVQKSSGSDASL